MTNKIRLYFTLAMLSTLTPITFAASQGFLIRTIDSSPEEFAVALKDSEMISYTDWLIYKLEQQNPDPKDLTEALEKAQEDPEEAYALFKKVVTEITKETLNSTGREMLVSVYKRISTLNLPNSTTLLYQQKAQDLILSHSDLKTVFGDTPKRVSKLTSLMQKEINILASRKNKTPQLKDAVVLMDGRKINFDKDGVIMEGHHQWTLFSNSYSPFIFMGKWIDFIAAILKEGNLIPLARGNCDSLQILSDDFQIQTLSKVFAGKKCFAKDSDRSIPAKHLIAENHFESDTKYRWVVPTLLVLGTGLAYSLKDKNVSIRMPSFR